MNLPGEWRRVLQVACSVAVAAALAAPQPATAARKDRGGGRDEWVTAFGASQNGAGTATLTDVAVRMIGRVSIPGEAVRIRLDNTYGTEAVTFGHVHVGPRIQGARVAAGWNRPVSFFGRADVTIPAGGSVVSDPVRLQVFARQDLAVSFHVVGSAQPSQDSNSYVTSYYTEPGGDPGAAAAGEDPAPFTQRTTAKWWLKSIDVLSSESSGAIVAFGDSITDGTCTTVDAHDRWEDWVSVRLDSLDAAGTIGRGRSNRRGLKAMVNEGIGGNTVVGETVPPPNSEPGVDRLGRDVLSHHGVTHVVLFMGTNDIRREVQASELMAGMTDIIQRVKAAGMKIIGATIIPRHNRPPDGDNTGWDERKTAIRNQVNQWIRTQAPFDAVIDFDEVVRDPANPDLIFPPFDCGDGIHPSPAGYYQMGQAVDLRIFDDRGR